MMNCTYRNGNQFYSAIELCKECQYQYYHTDEEVIERGGHEIVYSSCLENEELHVQKESDCPRNYTMEELEYE
ncbi:MAG: hypothetical protein GY861_11770 [bacterium]|nr:hypothetical protein [bacterium]